MKTIKYLCICDYGQVRSVAMAWYIHGLNREDNRIKKLQYEAIPIGSVTSSKKTMKMMKKWADVIIDVRKYIPLDKYGNPNNPELMEKCREIWEKINLKEELLYFPAAGLILPKKETDEITEEVRKMRRKNENR